MLLLRFLQPDTHVSLRLQSLIPLPLNLLIPPHLLPGHQLLQLVRVELLRRLELPLLSLHLRFDLVQ